MRLRIITSFVLLALALFVILGLPDSGFAVVTGLLVVIAGFEWFRMTQHEELPRLIALIGMLLIGGLLFYLTFPYRAHWVALFAAGFWAVVLVTLVRHRSGTVPRRSDWLRTLIGLLVLPVFWYAINRVHAAPNGPWLLIFGMTIVAVADSLAYFVGRAVGRRKLAPAISPGKSIEGVLGGLVGVAILAAIGALLPIFADVPSWQLGLWSAVIALISVAGDLEESRLKREAGVKDSGRILPGHGGLLDRLDGQFAAMPLWLLALWQMNLLNGVGS